MQVKAPSGRTFEIFLKNTHNTEDPVLDWIALIGGADEIKEEMMTLIAA